MTTITYRTESPYAPQPVERAPPDLRAIAGKDRPLRILLPSYRSDPFTGGQGIYMYYISRALADRGHTIDVISGPPYPRLDPRVSLIKLPSLDLYARPKFWGGFPVFPARDVKAPIDLYEYLMHISGDFPEPYTFGERMAKFMRGRISQYDVVHDNQTLCWGLLKIRDMGLPVVGTLHHPITMDRRIAVDAAETLSLKLLIMRWYGFLSMQKKVARRLDPLIVVSESTRTDVARDWGIDPKKTELVYHGVDLEKFRPRPDLTRESNLLVATASADVPLKGLIYLIEAYAKLLEKHPALRLEVIGKLREGQTKRRLEALGIIGRVKFIGGLSDAQLAERVATATIAVTPSVYEGFGFPAAEAMACGTPVVSTTGGSLPEVVGDAGLLVPPKDSDALATAIDRLLSDAPLRETLGRKGRRRMETSFSWAHTAASVESIYRRLIAHANR